MLCFTPTPVYPSSSWSKYRLKRTDSLTLPYEGVIEVSEAKIDSLLDDMMLHVSCVLDAFL